MAQEQQDHQPSSEEEVEEQEVPSESASELDVDGILEEIDDVLEENAEEFVTGFVQGNGE